MGLDLYSKVEPYLGFDDEVKELHLVYKEIIDEIEPKTLLDLGCGRGDFLELFLSSDIKTCGIDLSGAQVDVCLKKGLDAKNINLFDLNEKYDSVTAVFDVLNYIPKDDLSKFIKKIYDSLNKSGYFIFDINSKFAFEEIVTGSIVIDKGDRFIAIDALYQEPNLQTNITQFLKNIDGTYQKEQDSIDQFYHSKEFLKKVLKKSGFDIETIEDYFLYGYDMADKLIFICKKS
jgi:predicted TPR repeat methyltransferase